MTKKSKSTVSLDEIHFELDDIKKNNYITPSLPQPEEDNNKNEECK